MESKTTISMMMTIVVAIVIVVTCAIPVISETTQTTDTFTNSDYYCMMDKLDSSSSHTITWANETKNKITVDNVDFYPDWSGSPIIYADGNNLIRCSSTTGGYYLNIVGSSTANGVGSSSDLSATITIAEGTTTYEHTTSGGTTSSVTSTFDRGYCIIPGNDGEYVLAKSSSTKYILGDTELFTMGYATISGAWQNVFSLSGTIKDGITVTFVSSTVGNDQTITSSDPVYTENGSYVDLYSYSKTDFTASVNGVTKDLSLGNTIVPYEVTAERSIHADSTVISVVSIIPMLLVLSIVMGAVYMFITTRRN